MKKKESLSAHGAYVGILKKADGTVSVVRKDNLILDGGIDLLCDALGASTRPAVLSHIAIGSGTDEAANTQTALVKEITRKACTYSHTKGTASFTMTATFNAGEGTGAITEAGIVNADTGGTLLDRVTFAVVNKGADDVYTSTFTITFSRA